MAQAKDAGARLERVADGVYVIVHDDATDQWPHGNTGVVVTDEGVLVVDATYLPSRARADIALIRTVTKQPVRYLVYTHWHFDHNNGGDRLSRGFSRPDDRQRAADSGLHRPQRRLVGPDVDGEQLRPPRRAGDARAGAGEREGFDRPRADGRRETSPRGGRRPAQGGAGRARDAQGGAAQPRLRRSADTLARRAADRAAGSGAGQQPARRDDLPAAGLGPVHGGHRGAVAAYRIVGSSWPVPWIEVLQRMETVPVKALVPGHGPVMRDFRYVRQVRAMLEAATTRVAAMALKGRTLDQVQDSVTLGRRTEGGAGLEGSDARRRLEGQHPRAGRARVARRTRARLTPVIDAR